MAIKVGSANVTDIKIGGTSVDKVMVGTTVVWARGGSEPTHGGVWRGTVTFRGTTAQVTLVQIAGSEYAWRDNYFNATLTNNVEDTWSVSVSGNEVTFDKASDATQINETITIQGTAYELDLNWSAS